MFKSEAITSFRGKNRFLSNFYPSQIIVNGWIFPTVEHLYQAMKTSNMEWFRKIIEAETPGKAKKLGRDAPIKKEFLDNNNRLFLMKVCLVQKFKIQELKQRLFDTYPAELIEGNTWGDTFWGQCPVGTGHNYLGKLLMEVREDGDSVFPIVREVVHVQSTLPSD